LPASKPESVNLCLRNIVLVRAGDRVALEAIALASFVAAAAVGADQLLHRPVPAAGSGDCRIVGSVGSAIRCPLRADDGDQAVERASEHLAGGMNHADAGHPASVGGLLANLGDQ